MSKAKVAITVDARLLDELDQMIARHGLANRSQAIEAAIAEKLDRVRRSRLARECDKLDPAEERQFAEEGLGPVLDEWPEY